MGAIKRLTERLACLHSWSRGVTLDLQYGKGALHEFNCRICKKRIARWAGDEPISGAPDPRWEHSDPNFVECVPVEKTVIVYEKVK